MSFRRALDSALFLQTNDARMILKDPFDERTLPPDLHKLSDGHLVRLSSKRCDSQAEARENSTLRSTGLVKEMVNIELDVKVWFSQRWSSMSRVVFSSVQYCISISILTTNLPKRCQTGDIPRPLAA